MSLLFLAPFVGSSHRQRSSMNVVCPLNIYRVLRVPGEPSANDAELFTHFLG